MPAFRSLLFVPANRPERFARAAAAGADMVCLDLEDAVPPAGKDQAREDARAFLAEAPAAGPARGLRINAMETAWANADLAAAGAARFVMIPKVGSAAQLEAAARALPGEAALWPLIETAEGLMNAWAIAAAPRVGGVLFGAFDFAADVGCTMDWEPLLFARSQIAAACARARVELLDAPSGDIRDHEALAATTKRAKALGFTGRACIHPDQVAVVNHAFTPSTEEVAQARRVIAAFEASEAGAAQLDGKLIELPVALAARRVLARAGE